jgi:CO dehydrogenase maturation factor
VKLLVMGTVESGGGGCVCPENVMLKRVIAHLVIARDVVVILDMEAGLEHLGRGTADFVDRFIVVIEPGARSVQTYRKIKRLAFDIGVKNISVVANKIRTEDDERFLRERIPEDELLGTVRYSAEVLDADRLGVSPYDTSETTVEAIKRIKQRIDTMKGVN